MWHSRPPRGRSGGILLGVRTDTMDVLASSDGEYHVKLHIRNKVDNFTYGVLLPYMVPPKMSLRLIFSENW